jgi:predicted aspartyl protease
MPARPLLFTLLVLLAVSLYGAETPPSPSPPPVAAELPKGVVAVPFEIKGERLFVAAKLNDETACTCLIDTGSEVTLINRARVTVKNLRAGGFESLQGAFVGGIQSQPAVLKKLELGGEVLQNCAVSVVNHGAGTALEQIDMLLGMDLLGRARFTVDFKNSRLLFWPPGMALGRAPAGIERVQLAVQRGFREDGVRPRIEAKVNGKIPTQFLIDFGADTPLYVATRDFKELGFAPAGEPAGSVGIATAQGSQTLMFYRQAWPKLEFGAMGFEQIEGRILAALTAPAVAKQDLQATYNILGTPFLKSLDAIHIDMPAKTVYFERAKK